MKLGTHTHRVMAACNIVIIIFLMDTEAMMRLSFSFLKCMFGVLCKGLLSFHEMSVSQQQKNFPCLSLMTEIMVIG